MTPRVILSAPFLTTRVNEKSTVYAKTAPSFILSCILSKTRCFKLVNYTYPVSSFLRRFLKTRCILTCHFSQTRCFNRVILRAWLSCKNTPKDKVNLDGASPALAARCLKTQQEAIFILSHTILHYIMPLLPAVHHMKIHEPPTNPGSCPASIYKWNWNSTHKA